MPDHPPIFATTRWSVILTARDGNERDAAAALETLCGTYWRALYAYGRRLGLSPHDAEDATQGFFGRLLEKDYLQAAHAERGPFRAFLQMAFKRYLSKERERAGALCRGGGAVHLTFDFLEAETACAQDAPQLAADDVFESRWALATLGSAMSALREEYRVLGREREFEVLKAVLSTPAEGCSYAALAAELKSSEGAVRVAAHRLRKRFRELFRLEVSQTVAAHEDISEEVRHLVSVLVRQ